VSQPRNALYDEELMECYVKQSERITRTDKREEKEEEYEEYGGEEATQRANFQLEDAQLPDVAKTPEKATALDGPEALEAGLLLPCLLIHVIAWKKLITANMHAHYLSPFR
jgi:hypothetical protein